jgi:sortase A
VTTLSDPQGTTRAAPPAQRFRAPLRRANESLWNRRPRTPESPVALVALGASLAVFAVAAWVVLYALVLSGLQESHAQSDAYATFREQLAQQTAPLGGVIRPDAPVALLDAPALGLHDAVVVEGTASGDLTRGPGHRRDSPLPGQVGAAVVYGRATLFGGVFGSIVHARPGDLIKATTGQGVFRYEVIDVRHVGDPYPAPSPDGGGSLTLVTAEGASAGNVWQPKRPVYVDARLVGKAAPSPGVGAAVVPKSENAMSGDAGSLFELVLWLPLLGAAAFFVVWASVRWGRWQAWLIGVPLIVGAAWGVTQTAVLLLPNVM